MLRGFDDRCCRIDLGFQIQPRWHRRGLADRVKGAAVGSEADRPGHLEDRQAVVLLVQVNCRRTRAGALHDRIGKEGWLFTGRGAERGRHR